MKYSVLINDASIYQSNARAENGRVQPNQWSVLCEYVLFPVGAVVALFLTMFGAILFNR